MGDVVDHVEAGHALGLEEEDGLAFLLAENGHQHVGPGDLALAGGLHVKNGALQHALEAERGLGIALLVVFRNQGSGGVDKLHQVAAQGADIGAAGFQHTDGVVVVQQRQQQVFDSHELVPPAAGAPEGLVQCQFQVFTQHTSAPGLFSPPMPRSHTTVDVRFPERTGLPGPPWFRRCPGYRSRILPCLWYVP